MKFSPRSNWINAFTGALLSATLLISLPAIAQYRYASSIFNPSGGRTSRSADGTIGGELDAAIKYYQPYQTFAEAALAAGLIETFRNSDQTFTVFVPTDEAFAALPADLKESLFQPENKDKLLQLLNYHVIPGEVTVEDIEQGSLQTSQGNSLKIELNEAEDQLTLNDQSVIQSSTGTRNGVIVLIDRVLLPEDLN
ncbi:MAG: fasciclin domain-containing protein [Microcoleaceae cyanobacterium]